MVINNDRHSKEPGSVDWPVKTVSPDSLLEMAREAEASAYAPYSHFKVGAAVLGEDGTVVSGGNVENVSYSVSLCAERNAMSSFVSHNRVKPVAIAIAAGAADVPCFPCGACLQFLNEFNPDLLVVLEKETTSTVYTLRELLPHPFSLSEESR